MAMTDEQWAQIAKDAWADPELSKEVRKWYSKKYKVPLPDVEAERVAEEKLEPIKKELEELKKTKEELDFEKKERTKREKAGLYAKGWTDEDINAAIKKFAERGIFIDNYELLEELRMHPKFQDINPKAQAAKEEDLPPLDINPEEYVKNRSAVRRKTLTQVLGEAEKKFGGLTPNKLFVSAKDYIPSTRR